MEVPSPLQLSPGRPSPPPSRRGGPATRAEAAEGARQGRPRSRGGGQRLPLQNVLDGSHLFRGEVRAVDLPAAQGVVPAAVACADPPEVESCCPQGDEEILPADLGGDATPRWPAKGSEFVDESSARVRGGRRGRLSAGGLAPCRRECPAVPAARRCDSTPAFFSGWGRRRTPARRCGLWWRRPRAGEPASPRALRPPSRRTRSTRKPAAAASLPRHRAASAASWRQVGAAGGAAVATAASADEDRKANVSWRAPAAVVYPGSVSARVPQPAGVSSSRASSHGSHLRARARSPVKRPGGAGQRLP